MDTYNELKAYRESLPVGATDWAYKVKTASARKIPLKAITLEELFL